MEQNHMSPPRVQLLTESTSQNRHPSGDAERSRQSRSSSTEPTNELLLFVPLRQRNAVSRREDETDNWCKDIDTKEDFRLRLTNPTLGNMLLSRLETFRKNRELCDVVLFVKEKEIRAHKVVLASLSPALFDLFNLDADETNGDVNQIQQVKTIAATNTHGMSNTSYYEFNQGDTECFEALVEYAYTGKLNISSHKISDMYKTAYALQVSAISTACAHYLADNLSYNNCIGIRRHANFNDDTYLVSKVDSFIVENFDKIIDDSLEFTKLPCVKAKIIVPRSEHLRNDNLAESLTMRALAYFQNYTKMSDRVEQQIEALVQKSHLLYIEEDATLQDCAKMDDHSSVGSCVAVQDYKQSKQSKTEKTVGHNSQVIGIPIQHHVTGALPIKINASRAANAQYASNESLNSMASTATDVEDEIETKLIAIQQTSSGFWIALAVLYKRLVVFSIQLCDDENLAGSGESAGTTPPMLQEPTLNENQASNGAITKQPGDLPPASILAKLANCTSIVRHPLPSMSVARCSVGAAFLNGRIIVCGGYSRGQVLNSAEEYEIETGQWNLLPPMTVERGRFDAATLNGRFYAVAGSSGNSDLKSAECYDPKAKTWTSIAELQKARSQNGCAALDGFVYCTGGSSDQQALRECERYDPARNIWEAIPPLTTGRFGHGCATWRGMIVVAGGCDRWGQLLDSVEAFDPKNGGWKVLPKLSTPRRGCAISVIRDSLFVVGGHDGSQSLQLVEILDHPTGHWRPGPSLTTPRANAHAVTSASNSLYIVGGFEGASFLSTMEILESEGSGWRSYVQKRFSQDAAIAEDDEEIETTRSSSEPLHNTPSTDRSDVTPRATAAII
ncbi:BTB domain-containing protein [Aphelenchoides besseyi]|nr:BTB domain-containing protein [Aphelenchoides besseyi]